MEASLFDFLREVLMPRPITDGRVQAREERRDGYPPTTAEDAKERLRFAMKFQQYTGPVHAKGLEDTAFYRYNVLLSLNEVGGDADRVGRTVEAFHEANARRLSRAAVRDDRDRDARHQARRGHAGADQRHLGAARRLVARGGPLAAAEPRPQARSWTASRRPIATTSTGSTRRSLGSGRDGIRGDPTRMSSNGFAPT